MPSLKKRITKRTVDSLRPGQVAWDTELNGFGVRCQKHAKSYVLKYRFQGRQRWLTIGKHGQPWTPDLARRKAISLLGQLADGSDPAEVRDEVAKDITIGALCDLYLKEGCQNKKASTVSTDTGRIKRHIKPLLGKRRVRSITRTDVKKMMHDIASGKTAVDEKTGPRGRAIVSGGEGTATKSVTLLGAIFSFAIERGLRSDSPVQGIKVFKSKKMERFLSPAELARLGEALVEAETDGTNPAGIAAIRLLIMTGCRKSEILTLKWEYVDFERSYVCLPDSKTGAKNLPIGAPVLELLNSLPRLTDNPFVLPGAIKGGHYSGLPKVWRKIRAKAGLDDVRLHDLRHSFASVGASAGDSLLIIGRLLGHTQAATTQRYAHLSDDPLKASADRISGQIAAAMRTDLAEVVKLKDSRT